MKVYVLSLETYHDTSHIESAFASLESAMASMPDAAWNLEGWYVDNWAGVVAQAELLSVHDTALIHEMDLRP